MACFLRCMSSKLAFQLQFHRCYVKQLDNWFTATSNQQLTVCSETTVVRILSEMTERFQRLKCAEIKHLNLQATTHPTLLHQACLSGLISKATITYVDLVKGGFQDGHPRLPVTVRHGSSLSSRRLPVGLRRRSSSAAFCDIEDVCCETDIQQLWRQVFCSCRSEAAEQPSS